MQSVSIFPAGITKKQVERASSTPLPAGTVCLFACYVPDGNLPLHTRFYLKNLLKCGVILHIILSGAEVIHENTNNFCIKHGIHAWKRPNGSLDFGAWQFLLEKGLAKEAPYILFANDSVFGPLAPACNPTLLDYRKSHFINNPNLRGSKNLLVLSVLLCFHFPGSDWMNGDMKPLGFFDVEEHLARLSGLGDQLEAFSRTMDFEVFQHDLDKPLAYADGSKGGCPPLLRS